MDFEVLPSEGSVSFLTKAREPSDEAPSEWFARAVELEAVDRDGAERAYRCAIAGAPDYLDPYLNLGVMLCDSGRCAEAVDLYAQAIVHSPAEPLLHFNLAVALEDAKRFDEALASYDECMRLSPDFADAHYNAARLHEMLGHKARAIRHYSEYRRLQR